MPCIGTQRCPRGPSIGYNGMNGIARSTVGIVLAISVPWPAIAARTSFSFALTSARLEPSTT